jgi:hypothetical protein
MLDMRSREELAPFQHCREIPMTTTLLSLTLLALLPGEPTGRSETSRQPSPFAPSLPQLSDNEEDKLDDIIDRFIQFDTGKLKGEEGKKAKAEFDQLGPEATFALIRGVNRAAKIESSCPALIIARKLRTILNATNDGALLDFARENIGIGVGRSRHMDALQDLRVVCILRKRVIGTQATVSTGSPGSSPYRSMRTSQLAEAAGTEQGPRRKQIVLELGLRRGDEALVALASIAATSSDKDIKQLARDQLDKLLSGTTAAVVKEKLKDDRAEIRAAAARVAGSKGYRLGDELIELLGDAEPDVRQAARRALIRLSRGVDFGPERDADEAGQAKAMRQWRAWWSKQGGR